MEYLKLKQQNLESRYFVLNVGKQEMARVSKGQFSCTVGPTLLYQNNLIKYKGATRENAKLFVKQFFSSWKPQFLDKLKEAWSGCTVLVELLGALSKVSQFAQSTDFTPLLLHIIEIMWAALSVATSPNWINMSALIFKVWTILHSCKDYKVLFDAFEAQSFKAQGLEDLALSMSSFLLPQAFVVILKRMQLLTSAKILDDSSSFQSLYDIISDLFSLLFKPLRSLLPDWIITAMDSLSGMGGKYVLLREARFLLDSFEKDQKQCIDPSFILKVKILRRKWNENASIIEYARFSATAKATQEKFENLYKCILSHEEVGRKEPNCFIFEGKPGSFKTVMMNQVIKAANVPSYSHIVKTIDDGKDFYDTYRNEKIFYMDDVGQQGVSQWRMIINMVSSAKMPLSCAEAKLKNTKFFNSEVIFASTNSFMTLHGICKNDGIADLAALHRRGLVFDCSNIKQNKGKPVGFISFKHFDLTSRQFVEGFHPDVIDYLTSKYGIYPTSIPLTEKSNRLEYIIWMSRIIDAYSAVKESYQQENELSEEEINQVQGSIYKAQSFEDASEFLEQDLEEDITLCGYQSLVDAPEDKNLWRLMWDDFVNYIYTNAMNVVSYLMENKLSALIGASFCIALTIAVGKLFERPTFVPNSTKLISKIKEKIKLNRVESHSFAGKVANQVHCVEIRPDGYELRACLGLVSGHKIIVPNHIVFGSKTGMVSIAHQSNSEAYIVDNREYFVEYANVEEDVAVLSMPMNIPTYWKNVAKGLEGCNQLKQPVLCLLGEIVSVPRTFKRLGNSPTIYYIPNTNIHVSVPKENHFYDLQEAGMCGAMLCNYEGQIFGMHVTGSTSLDVGAAIIWSDAVRNKIRDLLKDDVRFIAEHVITKEIGSSGSKIDLKVFESTPTKTSFVPSPIYEVFPCSRSPANLSLYGAHTVKDVAKKSFIKTKDVPTEALAFARRGLDELLVDFNPLTEYEVIKGNEFLAPMNKDSSNGFGCKKEKSYYIDFELGKCTPQFRLEINELEDKICNGDYSIRDWMWKECTKDEIRNNEKEGKPRSFRISRVHNQFLVKKYFGNFVKHIIANRDSNQIMIGVNPFKEWKNIARNLQQMYGVWAGDIGGYDGNMLPQLQAIFHDVLMSNFIGSEREKAVASFLLRDMYNSAIAVNDDVWLTTHSMPSGSFLTAIGNSFINRGYTLMWYYLNVQNPSLLDFKNEVCDYVYGDDKLNGIKTDKYVNELNAITMETFFKAIGMTFTTANKLPIDKPFESLAEVSFLKRSFQYHSILKQVMCPLDKRTLYSGLSWIDRNKDTDDVMRDKIATFQREIFLHLGDWHQELSILQEKCRAEDVPFVPLSLKYLVDVYTNTDPSELQGFSWGGTKYV
jgi:hypothetical protein